MLINVDDLDDDDDDDDGGDDERMIRGRWEEY